METEDTDLTLEQVKAFFEANKDRADIAEYLLTFATEKELTTETVNAYLETPEGKVVLQPRLDRYATQAIRTHDEKQAPVIEAKIKAGVNEGIRKLHPEETEEQKQIREMREDMERMKKDGEQKELRNSILMEAKNRNVPLELVNDIPYPSLDHFKNTASIWDQIRTKEVEKLVNEKLAANSYKPQGGNDKGDKVDISKLSQAELIQMEIEGKLDAAM